MMFLALMGIISRYAVFREYDGVLQISLHLLLLLLLLLLRLSTH
jgi:hypothetical protein